MSSPPLVYVLQFVRPTEYTRPQRSLMKCGRKGRAASPDRFVSRSIAQNTTRISTLVVERDLTAATLAEIIRLPMPKMSGK